MIRGRTRVAEGGLNIIMPHAAYVNLATQPGPQHATRTLHVRDAIASVQLLWGGDAACQRTTKPASEVALQLSV